MKAPLCQVVILSLAMSAKLIFAQDGGALPVEVSSTAVVGSKTERIKISITNPNSFPVVFRRGNTRDDGIVVFISLSQSDSYKFNPKENPLAFSLGGGLSGQATISSKGTAEMEISVRDYWDTGDLKEYCAITELNFNFSKVNADGSKSELPLPASGLYATKCRFGPNSADRR